MIGWPLSRGGRARGGGPATKKRPLGIIIVCLDVEAKVRNMFFCCLRDAVGGDGWAGERESHRL